MAGAAGAQSPPIEPTMPVPQSPQPETARLPQDPQEELQQEVAQLLPQLPPRFRIRPLA